jgi:hypothetical protein
MFEQAAACALDMDVCKQEVKLKATHSSIFQYPLKRSPYYSDFMGRAWATELKMAISTLIVIVTEGK